MRPIGSAAMVAIAVLAGCAGPDAEAGGAPGFAAATTPSVAPDGFGSEPSLLLAADGAWYFTSVLGSVPPPDEPAQATQKRGDGLWKSVDEGATWTYLGKPDYPFGGGDSDLDELPGGRLLLTGQWRPTAFPDTSAVPATLPDQVPTYVTGGESVSYSDDGGATWTQRPIAGTLPYADRNWIAVADERTAYLVFNQGNAGLLVAKTTDAGFTWMPPVRVPGTLDADPSEDDPTRANAGPNGIAGDPVVGADGALYIPYGPGPGGGTRQRLFVSSDGGQTFVERTVHRTPDGRSGGAIFSTVDVDDDGRLYFAWAETPDGPGDALSPDRAMHVWLSRSDDSGATWTQPLDLMAAAGWADRTAVFPWVVAGSRGRVAVAFDVSDRPTNPDQAPPETQWWPAVAVLTDADAGAGPGLQSARVVAARISESPNHRGPLCTGGTACDPVHRQLGDFFEAAITADGRVVVVWPDDAATPRVNRVAVQVAGPRLA